MGERRKLALAQLFLRKPAVLILDEPSNDLDFQSETALIAALSAVARTRTVIVVTHSLRLVSVAAQIYHVTGTGAVEQEPPATMVPRLFGVKPAVPAAASPQEEEPQHA
ncbi:AAA family ATPase [Xylophilus sp.]|uniref:AAA family ATPase n=1 Tax=Xylophilus sp. TaxID=2653893 RepID=UPI003FCC99D0